MSSYKELRATLAFSGDGLIQRSPLDTSCLAFHSERLDRVSYVPCEAFKSLPYITLLALYLTWQSKHVGTFKRSDLSLSASLLLFPDSIGALLD